MNFKIGDKVKIVTKRTILRHRKRYCEEDCIINGMFNYCSKIGTIVKVHYSHIDVDTGNHITYIWPIWAVKKVKE